MNDPVDLRGPWRAIVRAPMVRIAIPFIIGTAVSVGFAPSLVALGTILLVVTVVSVIVILGFRSKEQRWVRGLAVFIWFLVFGLWWQMIRDPLVRPDHVSGRTEMEGPWAVRVVSINGASAKMLRADAKLLLRKPGEAGQEITTGTVMLTLLPDTVRAWPVIGDRLIVDAVLTPIDRVADPGGFDRMAWAASRGIRLEAFTPSDAWWPVDNVGHWTSIFSSTREGIAHWLKGSELPRAERALVKALVLGQRDELDSEQKESFARSGTVHVLAVSGMHVGIIFAILSFMFGWWGGGRSARVFRGILILLALWGYAGLTGASPSILRATIMFSLFTVASMMEQRTDHLNSLFAAAFVLLLLDPRMLGQIGFQLSFLAVLGIIVFYKPIEGLWSPESRVLRGVWSLAVVSLSAQLLVTPVSLYLFKAFPVWFLPANIVVVSAVGLAVNGAVALIVLYKVPVVGWLLTWCLTALLKGVGLVTDFFASLPGSYPEVRIGGWEVVLLYVLVLGIAAWWQWRWRSMRWVAAISLGFILVGWANMARAARERTSFVVYEDRNRTVASMTQGRTLVLLCHPDSFASNEWTRRRVERHMRSAGLSRIRFLDPIALMDDRTDTIGNTISALGRWRTPGIDVAFYDGQSLLPVDLSGRLDAVVIHDLEYVDDRTIEALAVSAQRFVLAGNLRWGTRNRIRTWCLEHDVPYHDVRDHGAFIIER